MKPLTLFLGLLLLALAAVGYAVWRRATEPARAWAEFLELEGVDIQTLPAKRREQAEAMFHRFAPLPLRGSDLWDFTPWRVFRRISGAGREEALAVATTAISSRPQELAIALHCWPSGDPGWRTLSWTSGCLMKDIAFVARPEAGECLSVVWTDGTSMYLHLRERGVVLLRTETPTGEGRDWPDGLFASPPTEPPSDWVRALESGDAAEVLSRLSWLGWRSGGEPHPYVTLTLGNDAVRAALAVLRSSSNRWIREAAERALRP